MVRKATSRSRAKPAPINGQEAERRQRAYAARRRAWAEAVGRPYKGDEDLRPPPGEVDAGPDE
jgi:hypothetical protein